MSPAETGKATAESVSPKAVVIAVPIVGSLLFITIVGAVFILIRAYRRRRRGVRIAGGRKGDVEGGAVKWSEGDWGVREGRLTREFKRRESIARPPPATMRPTRGIGWDPREIVERGFLDDRSIGEDRIESTVPAGRGYEVHSGGDNASVHVEEIALGVVPNIHTHSPKSNASKIERLTGSQLSNDLYEDKSKLRSLGHEAENERRPSTIREAKCRSYPPLNPTVPQVPQRNPELALEVGLLSTRASSPISESNSSFVFALKPPPMDQIRLRYPGVAALADAHAIASNPRQSKRLSHSRREGEQNVTQHIASQFNPARHERAKPGSLNVPPLRLSSSRSAKKLAPPTASFGDFAGLTRYDSKSSKVSRVSSISTFRHATLDEEPDVSPQSPTTSSRPRSWCGKSVLLLDDLASSPAKSDPPLSPPPPPPSAPPHGVRTSAVGHNHLTSPPYLALDLMGHEPELNRSTLTSKDSVVSLPSTVSSAVSDLTIADGLTPTPLQRGKAPDTQDDTSTVLSYQSEAPSNLTAAELEAEMRGIRERARRTSEERKRRRRREEEMTEETRSLRTRVRGFV